ncbi:MAG: protein translocase subunit SecF [Firmicutes bacterium]|nr:protein translocase subunit SecF [Bacillota bacterium]
MTEKKSLMEKFRDPNFKIARKGKWYAIAPLVLIVVGLIIVLTINFNLGLDFTGGRTIRVNGITSENYSAIRGQINSVMNDNNVHGGTFRIWQEDSDTTGLSIVVQFQDLRNADMDEVSALIIERIEAIENVTGAEEVGMISASASQDHITRTFIAVAAALLGILVYMLFRFKFTSGVAALIGLIHDVLVMMALVAIFRIQINAAFIAALITVIAYSVNNTLILFDRIRGIEKNNDKNEGVETMIDRGVKETFQRTMNTTITTLVPIFILVIFGVPLIREFAIPILFGLIAGTFSTIFVTTSLYLRFERARIAVRKRKKATATT